jgi:hypothetical protein
MKYNLTDEIKAKLSPEQLIIVDKWQAERAKRSEIMDHLDAGTISLSDAMKQIDEITPDYCEHERSIMSNCSSCDEIEKILNPKIVNSINDEISFGAVTPID